MKLLDQLDQYIGSLRASGRSAKTVSCYQERIGQFITYITESFYPIDHSDAIQLPHVQSYHDQLIDKGLSVSTRRTYLATIQGFLQWQDRQNQTTDKHNWIDQIEIPKRPRRLPPTALSIEEVRQLIQASTSLRNRAILTVMYACGLRRSEVVALNVGDLFINRQQLLVHGKGNKDRIVPISPPAIQVVINYLDTREVSTGTDDPMFVALPPRKPTRLTSNYLNGLFRRMPNPTNRVIHPHLLRHTYAVHLLRGGADVRHVQALLGHASPDTTNQYLGLVKDEIKRAYDLAMKKIIHKKTDQKPSKQAA